MLSVCTKNNTMTTTATLSEKKEKRNVIVFEDNGYTALLGRRTLEKGVRVSIKSLAVVFLAVMNELIRRSSPLV